MRLPCATVALPRGRLRLPFPYIVAERRLCMDSLTRVSACQKIDIYLNPKNKWRFKIAKNFRVR